MRDAGPTRRAVLGAVAVATIGAAVAGCDDGGGSDQGRRKADDAARERAYAATGALLARYDAVAARHPQLAERIRPLGVELRQHLTAFAGGATHPAPPPGSAPEDPAAAAGTIADWAQQASDERLTGLPLLSPDLARRLAATAACLAGHAQLFRSTS
ncbi:hypothetical protein [Embleya sp. AB8]|uniref:hypothetical protein n=1 Tax=Embleya sp. AB8 TaxID=3156304 RepID=UPI003C787FAD